METDDRPVDDLTFRWHDNVIYGLSFDRGEPDEGDWRSDLRFDIDFIAEWLCGAPGDVQFRVAPATLAFHDVTDLAIAVDQGDSGGRNALFEWSIDRVERQPLDRPMDYWRWTIHLHSPPGGTLAFCASGFTQTETAEAMLVDEQRLPRSARGTNRLPPD
jgi:hypothetical protein